MIAKNINLCVALFLLVFNISCAGNIKNSPETGSSAALPHSPMGKNANLVDWESQPQIVGQGNGLQLMLKTSESMNFIYAAYQGKGGQDLLYLSSHNVGDTFSKPYPINKVPGEVSSHGENSPLLRKGPGIEMYAFWQGGKDLKFARSMNFGRSFTPAVVVNDSKVKGYHSFQTMEVAPDGTIYVAWLDGRDKETNPPGTGSLYIAKSIDQGKSFGKNIKVSGAICPCCRPAIAFDDSGKVFISWRHVYEGDNRVMVVSTSEDKGETWSDKVRVTEEGWKINGCAHSGPAMSYANGKLFVVWYSGAGNKSSMRAAISSDRGASFKYLGEIQGEVLDANHPGIQIIENEAWVIFQGREPGIDNGWGNIRPWLMKISGTGTPSNPEMIPFLGDSVSYPLLFAGSGGRVYATWTELAEEGQKAILCRGRLSKS
ncbi:MAG: hypothetical protein NPINA01_18970 [Nitrospinaceae bacterium]|nr:MAG: hypothetical protein NPINA01_18970 [Nitrospinaceae bacterium]